MIGCLVPRLTVLCFFLSSSLSSLEEAGGLVRFGGGFRAGGESVSDDGACVGRLEFGRGAGVGDLIGGVATFGVGFDVDVDALGGSSSSSESGSVAESESGATTGGAGLLPFERACGGTGEGDFAFASEKAILLELGGDLIAYVSNMR